MNTRNIPVGEGLSARKNDNTAISEPTV
jgi:hypothetical protein